jgi:hypothetical protein
MESAEHFFSMLSVFLAWMVLRGAVLDRPDPVSWVLPLRYGSGLSPAQRRLMQLFLPHLARTTRPHRVVIAPCADGPALRLVVNALTPFAMMPSLFNAVWRHVFGEDEASVRARLHYHAYYPVTSVFHAYVMRMDYDLNACSAKLQELMVAQLASAPDDPTMRYRMQPNAVLDLENSLAAALSAANPALTL